MAEEEIVSKLGAFGARLEAVDRRITEHIEGEAAIYREIFAQLKAINDTLSQATGARKILVWVIATIFAGIALAKGWWVKP